MRGINNFTGILLGLTLAAPAYAQQPAGLNDDIVVTQGKGDQRVVCKKQKETMTRLPARTCKTVQQWNAIREQHIRQAKELIGPTIETRRGG